MAINPVAIALVLISFLKGWFVQPRLAFCGVLTVAFLSGCLNGLEGLPE